jgi:hypothetical protein
MKICFAGRHSSCTTYKEVWTLLIKNDGSQTWSLNVCLALTEIARKWSKSSGTSSLGLSPVKHGTNRKAFPMGFALGASVKQLHVQAVVERDLLGAGHHK